MANTNLPLDQVKHDVIDGVTVIPDTALTQALWGGFQAYMLWLYETVDAYTKTGHIFSEWASNNGIDAALYSEEKEDFSFYKAAQQAISEGKSYVITENLS